MIRLNAESLGEAMFSCYNGFNRKICIAFSTYRRRYDFAMSLQMKQHEGLIPATHYKCGANEIFFDTGSSIRMVDANDPLDLYGRIFTRRFHTVLYDPDITDQDILAYLQSCEMLSCNPQPEVEMEIDTQPLDDFLSEFNIVG